MYAFRRSLIFSVAIISAVPFFVSAQVGRSYFFERISQKFTVNTDTTVNVEETQTYNFTGEYHSGWRSIPLKRVSDINDISVLDGVTMEPLQYSPYSLDKTNSTSWGKYTYNKTGGSVNIEWYYDAKDTTRTWILKYKLIGALSFLKDKDELYWNLLTDYDVMVNKAEAFVNIPTNKFSLNSLQSQIYAQGATNPKSEVLSDSSYYFSAENIAPRGMITIAAGWPKGLIDRGAFWRQWFCVHYVLLSSVLIILATLLAMLLYWYFTEKRGKGRGTIIPEYEPPENLPPAMAELIVKEKITPEGWSATVIDLAVRGYLKITEEGKSIKGIISGVFVIFLVPIILFLIFSNSSGGPNYALFIVIAFAVIVFISWIKKSKGSFLMPKDYIVELVKSIDDDTTLHDYEKSFLVTLLKSGKFSTKEMRWNKTASRDLYNAMQKVQEGLYKEIDADTSAFEVSVAKEKYFWIIVSVLIFICAFLFSFLASFLTIGQDWVIIPFVAFICFVIFFTYIKFEARLSAKGVILKEEWLGFKMYLKTAERYRMQNLTPETFEKYLPYAIIFGVEKEWGKAFDGISMAPPSWYHSAYIGGVANTSIGSTGDFASGFSASAFSASFASSFSSAFSSSGGAGASGGGGGAGGGGGGGGGGAG